MDRWIESLIVERVLSHGGRRSGCGGRKLCPRDAVVPAGRDEVPAGRVSGRRGCLDSTERARSVAAGRRVVRAGPQ